MAYSVATGRTTATRTFPGVLLRIEGAVVFAAAIVAYARLDYPWWAFALFLLAPDLSMAGYAAGPRVGAITYNIVHALVLPVLLLLASGWVSNPLGVQVALIWLAHIGMDRAVGYGLKFPDAFKHTHLDEPMGTARG